MTRFLITILLALVMSSACGSPAEPTEIVSNANSNSNSSLRDIRPAMRAVELFFEPMAEPEANDWLATYTEPGETFEQYLDNKPTRPTPERHTIYIRPLGKFTPQESKTIVIAARFIEQSFDLPVKLLPPVGFDEKALAGSTRKGFSGSRQVKSGYILQNLLVPALPNDAAALIAFTNEDLFPDETMNYVFGQASLDQRVGVWSLFRLDDNADEETFLRRTMKIAVHETGHMFSMRHCTKYECVMSGTNHLGETDRRPVDACPECMAKICWMSDVTPKERYEKLAAFCRTQGLTGEARDFDRKAQSLREPEKTKTEVSAKILP